MNNTLGSRTLSISIDCHPAKVHEFVSGPENLPKWATAFCKSVRKSDNDWIMETPRGSMKARFVEENDFGVLDHYVNPTPEVEVYVPMRVPPNGSGARLFLL